MSGGARFLWMFTDGVTADLIREEARRLRLVSDVAIEGDRFVVAFKLGDLLPEDVVRLRDAVYKRLGIDDAEAFERQRITESRKYRDWLRDREKNPPRFRRRGGEVA